MPFVDLVQGHLVSFRKLTTSQLLSDLGLFDTVASISNGGLGNDELPTSSHSLF